MKILFLDIDGVLNRTSTKSKIGVGKFAAFTGLDSVLVKRLTRWLNYWPNVKVVLSSTWRLDPDCIGLARAAGIPLLDVTPNMRARQQEIQMWLSTHPGVEAYAILDDIQFFRGAMAQNFVQTGEQRGLEDKHLAKLEEILNLRPMCDHLSIVDEIDNRIAAFEMTGNGTASMVDLLGRARDFILEHQRPIRERMLEFQRGPGSRSKIISHPDCEKCKRTRAQDRASKAKKHQSARDQRRIAASRSKSSANLKPGGWNKKAEEVVADGGA